MWSVQRLMNEPRFKLCDNYLHNTPTRPTERCRYGRLVSFNVFKWHYKVTVKRLKWVKIVCYMTDTNVPKMNWTDIYGRRIKYDMDQIDHSLCVVSVHVFLWVTLH